MSDKLESRIVRMLAAKTARLAELASPARGPTASAPSKRASKRRRPPVPQALAQRQQALAAEGSKRLR